MGKKLGAMGRKNRATRQNNTRMGQKNTPTGQNNTRMGKKNTRMGKKLSASMIGIYGFLKQIIDRKKGINRYFTQGKEKELTRHSKEDNDKAKGAASFFMYFCLETR